ncbi:MAG: glycoside hydrolase family 43 protein [Lachnospiraceae bacterium]|nr:glycoside hydrolase family 43 protein [Lachnospiraceae bacterium]
MGKELFRNPIIQGGYPDPSICRVGEDYYMVTSSFYYFPGLPIFHSKDLVNWEQLGNAISRPEQLDFKNCSASEGLWAATIRYHNGRFYIVNTLDVNGRTCRYNFIITAEDPAGPWSDAIVIEGAEGIDPSLYFDEDGRIWYCSNLVPEDLKYPEQKVIYACELDAETFQIKGEKHVIFDSNMDHTFYTEAPHIFHVNGMYYLMTASGGTQTNHCVNIYRSKELLGSYEPCPRNPIVTNRNVPLNNMLGISVVGHGDLVCTQNDEWYMVLLGIRPYEHYIEDYDQFLPRQWIRTPDRNKAAQFNLGREVFLLPMAWDYDEWPIVDNHNGMVNIKERRPNLPEHRFPMKSRIDQFEEKTLDFIWCMRRPVQVPFYSLEERPGFLRLKGTSVMAEDTETPALLVRRQQHNCFHISTAMEFEPTSEGEEAGLIATQNEKYAILLVKTMLDSQVVVATYQLVNGVRTLLAKTPVEPGRVYLTLEGGVGSYSTFFGKSERQLQPSVTGLDGSILSTVVADGFVGTYIGMYASAGKNAESTQADFDWFSYETKS